MLLQYRSRLARMKAYLTQDVNERRQLLQTAEEGLKRCLALDPSDARTYVGYGKLLTQQKRYDEARKLYADGTTNTGTVGHRSLLSTKGHWHAAARSPHMPVALLGW